MSKNKISLNRDNTLKRIARFGLCQQLLDDYLRLLKKAVDENIADEDLAKELQEAQSLADARRPEHAALLRYFLTTFPPEGAPRVEPSPVAAHEGCRHAKFSKPIPSDHPIPPQNEEVSKGGDVREKVCK